MTISNELVEAVPLSESGDAMSLMDGAGGAIAGAGRLHRRLSSFGVLLLTLSCLSPVLSIYGIGSDVMQHTGTGAAGLFLLGIGAAVIWVMIYAELGSAYPYAGGDYVSVGSILGPWAGFATLAIWAVTAGPTVAFEAKTIATYTGELLPDLPATAITFGTLAAAVIVAALDVRTSALVTGVFLAIEMSAVLALIAAGFWHPTRGLEVFLTPPVVPGAAGALVPVAFTMLAVSAVNAVYATVGGNQALYFGEELRDPHRRMGRVVVMAGLIGAATTALPVIAVVFGSRDLPAILASPAPFAAFISSIAGSWAGQLLSAGVALAVFNAMIAQIMSNARQYYSLGRDSVFHPRFDRLLTRVHLVSGAPRAATLVVGAFSATCCFLSAHMLIVFLAGLTVYGLALVCAAILVGRVRRLTGQPGYWRAPFHPLAPVLGLVMAAIFAVSDLADADGRPGLVILGLVIVVAVAWHHFVLRKRPGGWAPRLG